MATTGASSQSLGAHEVKIYPKLDKSPLDNRSYRAIKLSNQLKVLLVSDNYSDRAAAALDVAVGYFSDPDELPGLTHFLEHMLFLGTEKYPDEGSYDKFLGENGGFSNAFTSGEHTNYHFEMAAARKIGAEHMPRFKEALDRFAQFFTAPLFTESATERELNAVHSEHQKNLQTDGRRMYYLKKAWANPDHPFRKFGTGSKETLLDTPSKDGINTRSALLEFHKKYYSANLMTLCIVGPYELDQLQDWVTELFSQIPNHNALHPSEEYKNVDPVLPEHRGQIFHVDTVKDIRQLEMSWITPSFIAHYHSKPGDYVAELLGDEGQGSVLSLLKKRGWADSLTAGVHNYFTFSMATVKITLTKQGVSHVDDVIGIVHTYIHKIKTSGIQERLYNEDSSIAETIFRFRERGTAINLVSNMASCMHLYPPAEYVSGPYLYKKFDPEEIMRLLDHLTPEKGNIYVAGKFAADKANRKERWYGTPYHVERIAESKMEQWRMGSFSEDLNIPETNTFIPTDFELLAELHPEGHEDTEAPKAVLSNEHMEVYHKLDRTFRRPKVSIVLRMETPLAYQSPWHTVMTEIFTSLIEDALTENLYPAKRTGFSYAIYQAVAGIELYVFGYSHHIDAILAAVVNKMVTFDAEQTRFEMIRDAVERAYINFGKNQPYTHCWYNMTYLLEQPRWHVSHYLQVLRAGEVTLDGLAEFSKEIRTRMHITALVSGNISEEKAISIGKFVQETINYKPLPDEERLDRRVVEIPAGREMYTRRAHPNSDDKNSAILVYFVVGPKGDLLKDVKLELMAQILKDPTFHELRTVQQLGYIVFEGVFAVDYVRGIHVTVQSTTANPDELLKSIDNFVTDFRKDILEPMSEEKFQDYVQALIKNKAEPDKSLFARSWRFWSEIDRNYLQYDRARKAIEALRSVRKEDIVTFFDENIGEGRNRRRIVSQVYGNHHPIGEKLAVPDGAIDVNDAMAFRRQNRLYPAARIHKPEERQV